MLIINITNTNTNTNNNTSYKQIYTLIQQRYKQQYNYTTVYIKWLYGRVWRVISYLLSCLLQALKSRLYLFRYRYNNS